MDRNTKKLIQELNTLKRQLSEKFIFGDGEEGGYPQEYEQAPEGMGGGMQEEPDQKMVQGDSEEEVAMHAHEVIQHEPIIGKIRETAIEGLKKYADHPTSSLYEFFKKVFLESDKVLTDTGKK